MRPRPGRMAQRSATRRAAQDRSRGAQPAFARPAFAMRFRRRRALRGGEPAAGREPGASRPPRRHSAARSADPAGGPQPPLAAARSPGGTRRRRVPPCRGRAGEERADRHLRPWRRDSMATAMLRRTWPPRTRPRSLPACDKAITTPSVWGARPEAAPDDVLMTWKQLVALHRQWHSLIKELREAEQALGQETTEANYSWLQDVKARLRSSTEPRR